MSTNRKYSVSKANENEMAIIVILIIERRKAKRQHQCNEKRNNENGESWQKRRNGENNGEIISIAWHQWRNGEMK
jgi:hypothetical protein